MALMLRCKDLGIDPHCDYVVRNGSILAILRRAIDHVETDHRIFPIPRELEDQIHKCMQADREEERYFARTS